MGAQNYGDTLVLFDKTFSASENGVWVSSASCGALRRAKEIVFVLDVTAAATDVGDTLDVKVQNGLLGAAIVPNDIVHFTQVLGNGGVKTYVARVLTTKAVTGSAAPSVALGAGAVVDGPITDLLRYVVTIVDAGTANVSFTASLKAYIKG